MQTYDSAESAMNNLQRGIYQPLADKVPIYDLADEDPEEEERSRAPLLVVIALVVLAAFAGVVWLAYNQGVERGRQGASLVIEAPEGPVRVAPPDTASPPDLNIYKDPVPPEQEAKQSALASQTPAASKEAPPIRLSPAVPAPAPATKAPPPAAAAPPPAAKSAPPAAAPAQVAQAAKAPPPPPAQVAQAAKAAPPPAPSAAASAAASRAVSGAAVLQLGAFESQELANGAWAAFRARHPSVAGLSPDVQRADLGAKGIVYRLRIGPFADRASATDACVQLKAAGGNCFVAAP
jgi:cell division protein FtsN